MYRKQLIPLIYSSIVCLTLCVTSAYAETETKEDPLAKPGLPGMCRGALHMVSAPLMVPYGLIYGLTVPFTSDPEMNGTTNYVAYSAMQTVAAPFAIAANTGIGAGGCCIEFVSGFIDVMSLGYYDLPDERNPENYDSRPYFIQTLSRLRNNNGMFFTTTPAPEADEPVVHAEIIRDNIYAITE